jgi:Rrf2 family iron-sulfur cluster assembly transcriptional regulator
MKLTSKGRYAVTAILDLAFHARSGPVPLPNIADRQGLSLSYLEQLFTRLRKAGLVESTRGPGGGYSLGRAAPEITVAEVIAAVDERVDNTTCSGAGNCHEGEQCLTHELWDDLGSQIFGFLDGISLQDLVNEEEIRSVAARQDAAAGQADTAAPPVE